MLFLWITFVDRFYSMLMLVSLFLLGFCSSGSVGWCVCIIPSENCTEDHLTKPKPFHFSQLLFPCLVFTRVQVRFHTCHTKWTLKWAELWSRPVIPVWTHPDATFTPKRGFEQPLSMKSQCKRSRMCIWCFCVQSSHIHASLCKFLSPMYKTCLHWTCDNSEISLINQGFSFGSDVWVVTFLKHRRTNHLISDHEGQMISCSWCLSQWYDTKSFYLS